MCGLFGWDLRKAGISREQQIIMATVLAAMNDNRGGDSWGMYDPDKDELHHDLGYALNGVLKIATMRRVLCHTRKATTGGVSKENAHPFRIGRIVGAHNGIIHNHSELNTNFKRECVVDSQHIFHNINEGKDLKSISGYGVITYVDTDIRKAVNLCRVSSGGDLSVFGIGNHPKYQGVVWSSTETALKAAFRAAGIEGFPFEVKTSKRLWVEDGHLFVSDETLEFGEYKYTSPQYTYQGGKTYESTPYSSHYMNYYRGERDSEGSSARVNQDWPGDLWDEATPPAGTNVSKLVKDASKSGTESPSSSYFNRLSDDFDCYGKMFTDGDTTCNGCATKDSCREASLTHAQKLGSKKDAKSSDVKTDADKRVQDLWERAKRLKKAAVAEKDAEAAKKELEAKAEVKEDKKEEVSSSPAVLLSPHSALV